MADERDEYGYPKRGSTPPPQVDQSKAKDFVKGFTRGGSVSEGYQNIKNSVSSWFGDSDDSSEKMKAMERRKAGG